MRCANFDLTSSNRARTTVSRALLARTVLANGLSSNTVKFLKLSNKQFSVTI